jgi:hypothetical protein
MNRPPIDTLPLAVADLIHGNNDVWSVSSLVIQVGLVYRIIRHKFIPAEAVNIIAQIFFLGDSSTAWRHLTSCNKMLSRTWGRGGGGDEEDRDGVNTPNVGRHSILSHSDIKTLIELVNQEFNARRMLTVSDLLEYTVKVLGKGICRDTFTRVLKRHNIGKIVDGKPLEEKRSQVSVSALERYYGELGRALKDVPVECVVNLDETGCAKNGGLIPRLCPHAFH